MNAINDQTKKINWLPFIILVVFFIFLLLVYVLQNFSSLKPSGLITEKLTPKSQKEQFDVKKFASEQEFKDYLKQTSTDSSLRMQPAPIGGGIAEDNISIQKQQTAPGDTSMSYQPFQPETVNYRQSETNVQVIGIDEPDIVKIKDNNIYYASTKQSYLIPFNDSSNNKIAPQQTYDYQPKTYVINALPATDLRKINEISDNGELLISQNMLIIFSKKNKVVGWDISNPQNPNKRWEYQLKSNVQIAASRLFNNKIYLITKTALSHNKPCPIIPYDINGNDYTIRCQDIYYPVRHTSVDSLYSISQINPQDGKVDNKISFIGSSSKSVIYMSPNSIYVTYQYSIDYNKLYIDFLLGPENNLLPSNVKSRLNTVNNYNISDQAKYIEFVNIINDFKYSLSQDEMLSFETKLNNQYKIYQQQIIRQSNRTGIVKINNQKLQIQSTGSIPGYLLNQFSMDEYNSYLRVATTISNPATFNQNDDVNDLYVLDKYLNTVGSVKNLGKTEKIYSVRFIAEKGYLVTFRQTDPFYVVDLLDPYHPTLKGELKIPGFSSYLHPLKDDFILGIGQEDRKVKLSLFDVSSPENPIEVTKYYLNDSWTEISTNHHAYTIDYAKEIFFIPTGKGGHIFSYQGNALNLIKSVSGYSIKRAVYINNYFYIIGDDFIVVFDENSWEEIKRIDI